MHFAKESRFSKKNEKYFLRVVENNQMVGVYADVLNIKLNQNFNQNAEAFLITFVPPPILINRICIQMSEKPLGSSLETSHHFQTKAFQ